VGFAVEGFMVGAILGKLLNSIEVIHCIGFLGDPPSWQLVGVLKMTLPMPHASAQIKDTVHGERFAIITSRISQSEPTFRTPLSSNPKKVLLLSTPIFAKIRRLPSTMPWTISGSCESSKS
jgi:hypothetical protein